MHDDVTQFFDVTALEVPDEIVVSDGRFSIAIVVSGAGSIEGDFGRLPVGQGQAFAWPASLEVRLRAEAEQLRVVRCLGPDPSHTTPISPNSFQPPKEPGY